MASCQRPQAGKARAEDGHTSVQKYGVPGPSRPYSSSRSQRSTSPAASSSVAALPIASSSARVASERTEPIMSPMVAYGRGNGAARSSSWACRTRSRKTSRAVPVSFRASAERMRVRRVMVDNGPTLRVCAHPVFVFASKVCAPSGHETPGARTPVGMSLEPSLISVLKTSVSLIDRRFGVLGAVDENRP